MHSTDDPWNAPASKAIEIIHAYLHTEGITDEDMIIYIENEINLYKQEVTASFDKWHRKQEVKQ